MKSTNTTFLKNYEVSEYLITDVQLDVSISENDTTVAAKLKIKANPDHPKPSGTIFLNGSQLTLVSVAIDNSLLANDKYQLKDDILIIPEIPESFVLTTIVKINPHSNSSLSGLYVSKNGYFTQCEAEGFRRITYFLDRPDIMAIFTTKITANKNDYPTLLSNGNLVKSGEEGDNHWVIWKDPFPKPCYLFAMVAANLSVLADTFITLSGRLIKLNIYVPHGQKNRCQFAMNALKNAMKWDENNFGLEIDLDQYAIVAVDDFNMGAMENKGL
ncbi:MAG: aminopeptidase N, partial [Proteobacteria bacterium]|nr:aminopeptidase N [Pseudomonadota bacterium]